MLNSQVLCFHHMIKIFNIINHVDGSVFTFLHTISKSFSACGVGKKYTSPVKSRKKSDRLCKSFTTLDQQTCVDEVMCNQNNVK